MKALLAAGLVIAATLTWAAGAPTPATTPAAAPAAAPATVVKGTVLEIKEVESYTYLRLKTKDGETWAAVGKAPIKKGAEVTIENVMVMNNFESKALKQTFASILFGTLAGAGGAAPAAGQSAGTPHGGTGMAKADAGDVKISKATGANARTVAEIVTKGTELKDKQVVVHGKVVKFNGGIMGKNWIHLRDGTGAAADSTNDILVTTSQSAKVGDVLTVKGVVHTDRDFGAGYVYKVLIEEATLQQ